MLNSPFIFYEMAHDESDLNKNLLLALRNKGKNVSIRIGLVVFHTHGSVDPISLNIKTITKERLFFSKGSSVLLNRKAKAFNNVLH